jgi:predicted DNA-binding protein (UPF0251 family)
MGRHPTEQPTPDLFPTATVRDAPAPTKSPAAKATTKTAPQRHILPKDLPNAVRHLSDSELDRIHAATLEEMKRRGKMPPGVETDLQTLRSRFDVRPHLMKRKLPRPEKRPTAETVPLTLGQVNAVRAVFKAGITPSRIARQFGLSQSNVRKALKSVTKRGKI